MTQISIVHHARPAAARPPGAPYVVRNGVAIVSIQGLATHNGAMLPDGTRSASMQELAEAVKAAAGDASVQRIVVYANVPSGSMLGASEAAQAIRSASLVKPVSSFIDEAATGPGYWIAAGAPKVYISGPAVGIGGIGIAIAHVDRSGADRLAGVNRTELTSGKFKSTKTLTPEIHAHLQAQIDYQHAVMVSALAKLRGMSVEKMKALADGRVLIGRQAITAGLVDGFSSLEALIRAPAAAAPQRASVPVPLPTPKPQALAAISQPPAVAPGHKPDMARAYAALNSRAALTDSSTLIRK